MRYSYKDISMKEIDKLYCVPGAFALAMESHQLEKVIVYFINEKQFRETYKK